MDKRCVTCAYEGFLSGNCYFPKPQDGTEPPFMTTAAETNQADDGQRCMQWRQNQKRLQSKGGKQMKHYWIVVDTKDFSEDLSDWEIVHTEPYLRDQKGYALGITDERYWKGRYMAFEVNEDKDILDFTPGMGPAPCWTVSWSDRKDDTTAWLKEWDKWTKETF